MASIAGGQRVGLVDANVVRVLARVFQRREDAKQGARLYAALADRLVAPQRPGCFNQVWPSA